MRQQKNQQGDKQKSTKHYIQNICLLPSKNQNSNTISIAFRVLLQYFNNTRIYKIWQKEAYWTHYFLMISDIHIIWMMFATMFQNNKLF